MRRTPFLERNPNTIFEILKPADIIAFQVRNVQDHSVSIFQNYFNCSTEAKKCVHTALYLSHGKICHSIPFVFSANGLGAVVLDDAYQSINVENRTVYVLRSDKISDCERASIALFAATRVGSAYNWSEIRRSVEGLIARKPLTAPHVDNIRKSDEMSNFLCSDLIYKSYDVVLGDKNPLRVSRTVMPFYSPADFFLNSSLKAVLPSL